MSHEPDSQPQSEKTEFEQAGEEEPLSFAREFLLFVRDNKKWWLIPILVVLSLIGLLVVLGSSGAAPFIYPLF